MNEKRIMLYKPEMRTAENMHASLAVLRVSCVPCCERAVSSTSHVLVVSITLVS
jgi:hypothetical protein